MQSNLWHSSNVLLASDHQCRLQKHLVQIDSVDLPSCTLCFEPDLLEFFSPSYFFAFVCIASFTYLASSSSEVLPRAETLQSINLHALQPLAWHPLSLYLKSLQQPNFFVNLHKTGTGFIPPPPNASAAQTSSPFICMLYAHCGETLQSVSTSLTDQLCCNIIQVVSFFTL